MTGVSCAGRVGRQGDHGDEQAAMDEGGGGSTERQPCPSERARIEDHPPEQQRRGVPKPEFQPVQPVSSL